VSFVQVPLRKYNSRDWGDLSSFGKSHDICCERYFLVEDRHTFIGGHRVRLLRFRGNVHWQVPIREQEFSITAVPEAKAPPGLKEKRHHKKR